MDLQSTIIKELAKVINSQPEKTTTLYYGTIDRVVGSGENKRAYVHIDGSAEGTSTPIVEGTEVLEGDRVIVTIENHQAIVMSNVTSPASARTATNYMDLSTEDEGLIIGELHEDGHTFNVLIKSDGVYIRDGVGQEAIILAKYGGEGTILYDDDGEPAAQFTANGIIFYQDIDGYVQYDPITGLITNAKINYADVENLDVHYANIQHLNAATARIEDLEADNVVINGTLTAHEGKFDDLEADNVVIHGTLTAHEGQFDTLEADNAAIHGTLTAHEGQFDILEAEDVVINGTLTATLGRIATIESNYVDTDTLVAGYAEIDLANVNNAWIQNGLIKDAAITDAQILGVSANKLTAGTIDANDINVANLRAKNLIVERMNGQPILGGYELVNKNTTGYSSKNPSTEGWYEYQNGSFVLSTDTTVNSSKAYYRDGNSVALYDQTYIDGLATNLNQRIDGAVETFTGTVVPTLVNYPAVDWTSAQMASHIGDIYYVVNNVSDEDGYCYRFAYDNTTQTYKWILIKDSDVTKALSDIGDLQDFQSETISWIDETDEGIEIIRQNHTTLSGVVNKTVKESIQLWFTKANETAPNAPNSTTYPNGVSDASTAGNGWRTVVPTYNASYPYYFYCWQYKFVDNTYGWSAVIYDRATSETQNTARTTSSSLASYITTNDGAIAALQNQLDDQLDIWYGTVTPTTSNTPASSWSTTTDKDNHVGDMYYDTTNGKVYQWTKSGNTYSWTEIPDSSAIAALAAAEEAQSTADGKRRVFTSQPTVPYDVGDLWVNGDEVKYATVKRTSGNYTASDWAQTATDDTVANANIKSSIQLWRTTNSETPPGKPYTDGSTSYVNSVSTAGNTWTTVVPIYNASYPKYHYCYQQQRGDGKYQWTSPVFDGATSEAMAKAQSALPASTFTTFQSTTFKDVKDTVDEHSVEFTTFSEMTATTPDGQTTTGIANIVSKVNQGTTGLQQKFSSLTQTLGTNADGTTANDDIMHKMTAVEAGLEGISSRVSKTEAQIKGMYAVCDTPIGTADKVAVLKPNVTDWQIYDGASITVKFVNGNTAAVPTLSIKPSSTGTGSTKKTIKTYSGGTLSLNDYTWKEGVALSFVYDGSYWLLQDSSLVSRVSIAESEIVQHSNQISLKVSETDITGNYIASKINLSGSDASISASKINFQGVADFDNYSLKTDTVSDILVEYAKSTSPSSFTPVSGAAGSWSTNVPTWTNDNTYIWQRITKSKADGLTPTQILTCIQGIKGDSGDSATVYSIITSVSSVSKAESGTLTPTSITFTAKSKTGTDAQADFSSGYLVIAESTNGTSWTNKHSSSSPESSYTHTISGNTVKFIRASLYTNSAKTILVAQEAVPVISDGLNGDPATTYSITPSVYAVIKNEAGTLSPASVTFSATSKTGTGDPTSYSSGYFVIAESTNGTSWTNKYQATSSSASYTHTISGNTVKYIRGSLYTDSSKTKLADQETVTVISDGIQGYSVVAYVTRDNFTEAQWTTYGTIDHSESWSNTSDIRNGCRVGDLFAVVGTSTDGGKAHTAIYRSTNASGNLVGTCIAHTYSDKGDDGDDAYTVILTNENHSFPGTDTAAVNNSSTTCNIIAYKGATQIATSIGTISGAPSGMTTSISNQNSTNNSFTVTVTSSMTTANGTLTIPVTADGKTFSMKFTYSIAFKGASGSSSQWYYGNKLVHTSGTASTATGITAAVVGDMYLNNETHSIYRCTTAGASGTAVWEYVGNLLEGLEIDIGATHRNLITSGDIVRNVWINAGNGEQTSSKCFSSGYIPVSASTKYTLQYWQPSNSQTGSNRAWTGKFLWYNSSKTYISGYASTYFADTHVSYTATSPSNAAYVRVTYQLPTGATVTPLTWNPYNTDYRWKLEVGDVATDWSLAPEDAIGEMQPIYYRSTATTYPDPPTARVILNTESNGVWTRYRNPMISITSPTYCHSFTCNQLLSIDGLFLGCDMIVFENGHATIDGGNIIGGTLTVGALDAESQSQLRNDKYITQIDSDGIFVHQIDTDQDGTTPSQSSSYGIHISDNIDVIKGGSTVASFGDVIILGKNIGVTNLSESSITDSSGNQLVDNSGNSIVGYSSEGVYAEGYNTFIDSTGLYIRNGMTNLAHYGERTVFYEPDGQTEAADISATGMHVKLGTIGGWTIDATKLSRSDGNNNTVKLISIGLDITANSPYGSQQLISQTRLFQNGLSLRHYGDDYMSEGSLTSRGLMLDSSDSATTLTLYGGLDTTPYVRVGERTGTTDHYTYKYLQLYFNLDSGASGLRWVETGAGVTTVNYSPFWISGANDIVIEGDTEMDFLLHDHTTSNGSDIAKIVFCENQDSNLVFRPEGNNKIYLGTSINKWKGIYGVAIRGDDVYGNLHDTSSSDLKEKSILENHDWKIDEFIQGLKPIAFKWKEGSTGRIHMGFGAQDVAKLTKDLKIGDLSVYSAEVKTDGEFNEPYHGEEIEDSKLSWTLRYTELIAPMVLEIQRLMDRVKELEDKVNG